MTTDTANVLVGEGWRDGLEAGVRKRIRGFIEELLDEELTAALGRARYARARDERLLVRSVTSESDAREVLPAAGHRNGHRDRQLMGTFGAMTVSVPRARVEAADGKTSEWHSQTLPAYRRRTKEIDAVIAGSYLAGTNTRRVGRALAALFRGSVSKDTVSRVWRKIKGDWEAWNARDLSSADMVRLILDGTVVRVRIDRKATLISLLVVLGVRADGQKVLLAVRNMLITANQPFGEWGKIFPDQAMTLASIDRLVHHATILEMNVESYRRREALDRKRGRGRPATHATIKKTEKSED